MPTGYTAGVEDGTITEFRDFALTCARAFGALVHMRDDSLDAEIKPREHSGYNQRALDDAKARLREAKNWSPEQAEERANAAYAAAQDAFNEADTRLIVTRKRYADMLAKVKAWNPPTKDHTGLRDFMIQQIDESQKYEYVPDMPKRLSGAEFRLEQIQSAQRDIAYHTKAIADEQKRIEEANAWVTALMESL